MINSSTLNSLVKSYPEKNYQKINVYLRNVKKKAIILQIQTPITISSLTKIITDKINITPNEFILFSKGKLISTTSQTLLKFRQKNIIHIVYLKGIHKQKISILLKYKTIQYKMLVSPKVKAKILIIDHLSKLLHKNTEEIALVYLGRVLDISKNLEQLYVQDEAEIFVLDVSQYLNKNNIQINIKADKGQIKDNNYIIQNNPQKHTDCYAQQKNEVKSINISSNNDAKQKKQIKQIFSDSSKKQNQSGDHKLQIESHIDRAKVQDIFLFYGFDPHRLDQNYIKRLHSLPYTGIIQQNPVRSSITSNIIKENLNKINKIRSNSANTEVVYKQNDMIYSGDALYEQMKDTISKNIEQYKQNFQSKKKQSQKSHN